VGEALSRRVRSLEDGGPDLRAFFTYPKVQWKTLRTTNVIEPLNEEFRRLSNGGAFPTGKAGRSASDHDAVCG
jgi:transposase-like protein